jgi:hypothetical protein
MDKFGQKLRNICILRVSHPYSGKKNFISSYKIGYREAPYH